MYCGRSIPELLDVWDLRGDRCPEGKRPILEPLQFLVWYFVSDTPHNQTSAVAIVMQQIHHIFFGPFIKQVIVTVLYLGCFHSSNDSAITIIPILSQARTNFGAGILCDVRIALHPISLRIRICLRIAASFTAAPNGPRSWWLQTPLNTVRLPFRKNPLSGITSIDLIPKVVVYTSFSIFPDTAWFGSV